MLVSTRNPNLEPVPYEKALIDGMAPDRALYVPTDLTPVTHDELEWLGKQHYANQFAFIQSHLVGNETFSLGQFFEIAEESYGEQNFPYAVDGIVTPVRPVFDWLSVQDLSGGPTAAFKDMALQPVAREMDIVLGRQDRSLTLLGATSGDTGSAAEAAVQASRRLQIFMLSPRIGMSAFQKAQMGVLTGENVSNLSVKGNFDDCQDIVKDIMKDPEFSDLGAVNSINFGRIAAQVTYYFSGYLQMIEQRGMEIGMPIDVSVPSGNFGNALAAHYARRMGLPIRKIIVASNENKILARLVNKGVYQQTGSTPTSSPSMDIDKASNLERLIFELLDNDADRTRSFMEAFESEGRAAFVDHGLKADALKRHGFKGGSSTHAERIKMIGLAYSASGEVVDPHTADAIVVAAKKYSSHVPILVMSTAKPVKFEDTMKEALEAEHIPPREKRFMDIEKRGSGGFVKVPNSVDAVKAIIRASRK